ncbi:TPA: hypothetical protein ACH1LG_004640 [Salmonella enterica]|nr:MULTISPECIES: hypothetical protein [Enterococcus]ELG7156197.1 hypothetical protein [Staphylococcus aureus]HDW3906990.1 hypothetical protein [Escherichia coli]ELL1201016.1 hypothetical protein [Staphylococcus aureus]MDN3080021.1 hypothetical protein [Enterococcus faecium]MDN3104193.1 hypothetical protein [Enterococcus faecalis]
MDTQRAHQLIDQLLAEDFKKLDDVHFRYFVFAGLVEGFDNDEQCIKDRADYAHLVPERLNGLPHVEEEKMAEFMHAVSGIGRDLCVAYDYVYFESKFGLTIEQAEAQGSV